MLRTRFVLVNDFPVGCINMWPIICLLWRSLNVFLTSSLFWEAAPGLSRLGLCSRFRFSYVNGVFDKALGSETG